jgi:hypothetical protein
MGNVTALCPIGYELREKAMPIGSLAEAETIEWHYRKNARTGNSPEDWELPNGWAYLGSGQFRAAFLSPTGVVYKVQKFANSRQSNRGEYEYLLELRYSESVKAVNVILPKAWLYTIGRAEVIAMEYMCGIKIPDYCFYECNCTDQIKTGGQCAWKELERIESALGLTDLHDDNVVFIPEQRKWAVIDLGA